MEEQIFQALALKARELGGAYGRGYERGIRRAYHGENFGTEEEHERWCSLFHSDQPDRAEMGRGYQDGLAGRFPEPAHHRPIEAAENLRKVRTLRMSDAEWEAFNLRGGAKWLRSILAGGA